MTTQDQKLMRFKMDLLRELPFYGDIVMRLPIVADPRIQTACTDGYTIRYNPSFFEKHSERENNFIIMHEIFHVLLGHNVRSAGRNHDAWNVACDLVVNSALWNLCQKSSSFYSRTMYKPDEGVFSGDVRATDTTENLYYKIMKLRKENAGAGGLSVMLAPGRKGWKEDVYPVSISNDLLEPSDEAEELKKIIVREAVACVKSRGDQGSYYIPNEVYELCGEKRVNWKTLLKDFLVEEIDGDTSYITPERKYIHMDLILPGHCKEEGAVGTVWVFIDSSGSISKDEMNRFLTETFNLCKEYGAVLNICYWDTSVTDKYFGISNEKDILKCLPRHSGGTDINCVFKWLKDEKEKPDCMVILTDGYFGELRQELCDKRLLRNTIMVLSSDSMMYSDEMKKYGKLASM